MPYNPSAGAGTTAAGAADAIWDETSGDHVAPGSTGKVLADLLASYTADSDKGLVYSGTVASVAGGNKFTVTAFAGLGAGKFASAVNPYMVFVLRDSAGASAAPQGELRAITGYTTATGEFTTAAFSAAVDVDDEVLIIHPQIVQTLDLHADLVTVDGLFDAPTADAADDLTIRDAVGRKTDAAVTTVGVVASIMAYVKGLLGLHVVPTADAVTDAFMRDVVGRKTDAAVTAVAVNKSIIAYLKGLMGFHTVAVADAVTNAQVRDPVGNKADATVTTVAADKSLVAYVKGLLSLHVVPTADAATDAFVRDVVGRKTDAAVTTVGVVASIMAYVKGIRGLHTVPTADAVTNLYMRDVVGIKTDAAVTAVAVDKSIVAYLKGLMGFHTVAVADAVTNAQMRDPIGNKADAAVTTVAVDKSIMGYVKGTLTEIKEVEHHLHNSNHMYGLTANTMANKSLTPITITTGADPTYGQEIQLTTGSVIPSNYFDLNQLYLTDFGTANRYTLLEFYYGTIDAGTACTFNADDTITVVGVAPADGSKVMFSAGLGAVDAGLNVYTSYIVRDSTGAGHTFKVALFSGEAATGLTGGTVGSYHVPTQTIFTEQFLSAAASNADAIPIPVLSPRIACTNRIWCRGKSITGAHDVKFFLGLHTYVA